ncbi:MAG TPA: AAA family ATPase [Sedimentisphaerales bacterium]|nr:AAA family ATPase [Sedimentisphaerales bacterium]
MNDFERFEQLIGGGCGCVSIVTYEEEYALGLVRQAAETLKRELWIWSAAEGVRDGLSLLDKGPAIKGTERAEAGLNNLAGSKESSICVALDLAEHLRDGKTLRVLRDVIERFDKVGSTLVMIDSEDKLPEVIKSYARTFEISFPDEKELQDILRTTLLRLHRKKPVEIGITRRGLNVMVRNLRGLTRRQAEQVIIDSVAHDQRFTDKDINLIIAGKRRMIQRGGLLEYVQTPLDLSEIGGMKRLKKWLEFRKDAFGRDAKEFGLTVPRGVLMLGVQGAGKSLCAKAIATAWHQPLLRMDPSTLYASYIGESERNLREALRQTEMMSPVILWIDEIEKAFASAASRSADGGLSQRMFGTLLTWLQEHEAPVFVVATANDIEALPPELLRKGRFDEIFFVDLPIAATRKEILAIHLRKRNRDPEQFDLEELAEASEGYSGSEIEQAIISALHEAYANKREVDTALILSALRNSPPLTVTMAESVEALRAWAEGRCVPAD